MPEVTADEQAPRVTAFRLHYNHSGNACPIMIYNFRPWNHRIRVYCITPAVYVGASQTSRELQEREYYYTFEADKHMIRKEVSILPGPKCLSNLDASFHMRLVNMRQNVQNHPQSSTKRYIS